MFLKNKITDMPFQNYMERKNLMKLFTNMVKKIMILNFNTQKIIVSKSYLDWDAIKIMNASMKMGNSRKYQMELKKILVIQNTALLNYMNVLINVKDNNVILILVMIEMRDKD